MSALRAKVVYNRETEMWMGRERGGWDIEAPMFTTSWFLSFPFTSKQRNWDSAAPSRTVVNLWTGVSQCGPDNHHILCHPRGSALLQRYFFYKHLGSYSLRCPTQGVVGQGQAMTREQTESMNECILKLQRNKVRRQEKVWGRSK